MQQWCGFTHTDVRDSSMEGHDSAYSTLGTSSLCSPSSASIPDRPANLSAHLQLSFCPAIGWLGSAVLVLTPRADSSC